MAEDDSGGGHAPQEDLGATKVLDETTVQVEIAEDVRVRIVKGTISDVLNKTEPAAANTNDDKSEPSGGGEKKSLFSFGGKK